MSTTKHHSQLAMEHTVQHSSLQQDSMGKYQHTLPFSEYISLVTIGLNARTTFYSMICTLRPMQYHHVKVYLQPNILYNTNST
jgi:hypothetical protein